VEKQTKKAQSGRKITDFTPNLAMEIQDIDIWLEIFFMKGEDEPSLPAFFFVRDKGRFWKITNAEVLFIEAQKSYCRIQTLEKSWLILTQLGNFEAVLPEHEFLRIHRSYMIGLRHLQSFDHRTVYLPGYELPIGESYRLAVRDRMLIIQPPGPSVVIAD